MFSGILAFEWRYHTRQIAFYAMAFAVSAGAFMLVQSGYGPANVAVNSPYVVTQSLGLISLMCVFVLTVFSANAALRDVEHGMSELVFATPVRKKHYLFGRFIGAMLAGVTIMALATVATMIAPFASSVDPARVGAMRPLVYVWAMVVMVIPNLLLMCSLLFAVAVMTRSTLATYIGAVAIYALYLVCSLLVDSPLMAGTAPPTPEGLARAAMVDPFGLSAFFEQTRYWTPAQRGSQLPQLTGHLLLNRVLWITVACVIFAITYRVFSFRTMRTSRGPASSRVPSPAPIEIARTLSYRTVSPAVRPNALFAPGATLLSAVRLELRHILHGWTFLALLTLWTFVAAMQAIAQLGGGDYGTRILPTTGTMMDAMRLPLLIIGTITIVYYAAEILWRERVVRISALVDATSTSSGALYAAKAIALSLLPVIMTAVAVFVGILVQVTHGYTQIEPRVYGAMFALAGVPLILFAIAALTFQVLLPNRWLGMMCGFALALVARMGGAMGIDHPMLRYSAAPAVDYSEMSGFDGAGTTFAAFMLFWTACAFLLACVSWAMWRRGIDAKLGARIAGARRNLGKNGTRALALATMATVFAGAALFWQTNIAHAWRGRNAQATWSAEYESRYRRIAAIAQPTITAVRTRVDVYPREKRALIRGTYTLVNRSAGAIDTVWLSFPTDAAAGAGAYSAHVQGARIRVDSVYRMVEIALAHPLEPSGRIDLDFDVALNQGGIRATDPKHDIADSGSFITNARAFPMIGYRAGNEIDDIRLRRANRLTALPSTIAKLDTARATAGSGATTDVAWITLDATVSTSVDQTAFVEGRLDSMWVRDGRRFFHYVTDGPVTPLFAIVSGRYEQQHAMVGGVNVEVWYDRAHATNAPKIMDAAARMLKIMNDRFGQYPHRTLRIVETPSWSSFGGFALPGMIYFRETGGFLNDTASHGVELITRRTAHEVAHQWWGHTLAPADMEGASVLVETLAKYSEQLAVSQVHGDYALASILAFDEDRYLAGRALEREGEPPLMSTDGRDYLYYGKGAIVMNGLRDLLGGASLDAALARLIAKRGGPNGTATTVDLRNELRAEAHTNVQRELINEWLGDRTVYDLRIDTVSATAATAGQPGGHYNIVATIDVSKFVNRNGVDQPKTLNGEAFDVAIYADSPGDGKLLYAGKHVPVDGRIVIHADVAGRPDYIVADPMLRRIDLTRSNNTKRITTR